jgi:ABC-type sugar transport system ATPase subunit
VTHNITLASLKNYCRSAVDMIDRKKERQKVQGYVDYFHIKTISRSSSGETFSGQSAKGIFRQVTGYSSIDPYRG